MTVDRRKQKSKKAKLQKSARLKSNFRDEGEIIPPTINGKGELVVDLEKDGSTKTLEVKYLVAQAFVPNPDNKPFVIHKDGNKLNNNADNLAWSDVDED